MVRYNYIPVSFFLAPFICDTIIFAVPVLQDDFYESDSSFAALLQGMGFERSETEIVSPIPRLMNTSENIFHGSNSLIFSIDSKLSAYYITQGSTTSGDLVNAQIGQSIDFDNSDDGVVSSRWLIRDRRIVL